MHDGRTPGGAEAVDAGVPGEPQPGSRLRRAMTVIQSCMESANDFVGADDDVGPETARSLALLVARVRRACDGLEGQLSGRAGAGDGAAACSRRLAAVLSPREEQIAKLLADGYSNVNTAAICGVTPNTVRTLIRRLYCKLGVRNRADLVREVLRRRAPPDHFTQRT
jgi:DNA-binding CsgD family transcriptional regulator